MQLSALIALGVVRVAASALELDELDGTIGV
jgi:hypothetical protein